MRIPLSENKSLIRTKGYLPFAQEIDLAIDPFEQLVPVIHPSAFIHPAATVIGEVSIGEESSVWPTAVLRGDQGALRVGARTSIQDGSVMHATFGHSITQVGDECTVGHRVILHGCQVGNRCLIGMGSVLLDLAEIGDFSLVAAGSLVTQGKKFPPYSFILGSPARRIRELTAAERDYVENAWRPYQDLTRRYRR
jgi:carbonic anhydrase/acetyltransferase-like protein (isoleucine patch superfamily)